MANVLKRHAAIIRSVSLMTIYSSYPMIVTPLDAVKTTVIVLWDMHFLETVEKEEFTIKNPSNVLILMN